MSGATTPVDGSGTAAAELGAVVSVLAAEAASVDVSGVRTFGIGTVISGLMPDVAPSVDESGTAALAKVELSRLGGAEDGDALVQPPDDANGLNAGVTGATGIVPADVADVATSAIIGVIELMGRLGVRPVIPLDGHAVMLPIPIPAIGAPGFIWIAPSAEPEPLTGGAIAVIPRAELDSGMAKWGSGTPIAGATCARALEQPRQRISDMMTNIRRMWRLSLRADFDGLGLNLHVTAPMIY